MAIENTVITNAATRRGLNILASRLTSGMLAPEPVKIARRRLKHPETLGLYFVVQLQTKGRPLVQLA